MRSTFPFLFLLGLLSACPGDGGSTDDTAGSDTGGSDTGDEPTTGGEPADLNERELGASASAQCTSAMTHAAKLTQAVEAGDVAAATAAYVGTDLQTFVKKLDVAAERGDDVAISASLALGDPTELASAEARLHVSLVQYLRDNLGDVDMGVEDRYAAWDEAHCVWDGALRGIAEAADAVTWTSVEETITADIDAGFAAGHDAISGEPPTTAIDEWYLPANKQRLEKSLYRALQRVIVELAGTAKKNADPVAARRALELFASIESRLDGRNTPGIAQVQAILGGDPAAIDPQALLLELDIAFAKRTRTYASAAIDESELGVPGGYEGAVEGGTYAKLVVAGMTTEVAGFDQAAFLADWEEYAALVRDGSDLEALGAVSKRLIDTTCAYQTALGVATCSGDVDETM